jgi:hypothetical protein
MSFIGDPLVEFHDEPSTVTMLFTLSLTLLLTGLAVQQRHEAAPERFDKLR